MALFKILTYCGNYVDEGLLGKGIYTTSTPLLRSVDIDIESMITQLKRMVDINGAYMLSEFHFDNLRLCEFTTVELLNHKVNNGINDPIIQQIPGVFVSIPDSLYVEIEKRKHERYGGAMAQIDKQFEHAHGQFDTVEVIEKWMSEAQFDTIVSTLSKIQIGLSTIGLSTEEYNDLSDQLGDIKEMLVNNKAFKE